MPFHGSEHRSYPLPFDQRFSPLYGPNWAPEQRFRHRLTRYSPASPCGPFMVELFTAAGFSSGPRTWSRSGSGCHQPEGSPRRHTLNEPAFASPNPMGGFAAEIGRTPTLKHDGPDAIASRHFRIAPIPGATLTTSWLTEQASQGKASPHGKEIVSPHVTMQPSRTIG